MTENINTGKAAADTREAKAATRLAAREWAWPAALFVLTMLSRLPFTSRVLYHWDSVNFAYALRSFDVAAEQPQPPGYILYVGLARLVNLLVGDAQTSMVALSVLASSLAVAVLYRLGAEMFDRRTGLAAALFLAASPLFWFYGEIALPHALDTLLVLSSVWGFYRVMRGETGWLVPGVITLAVAGGVRQQTIVFLLPVLLFALRRVGWRLFLLAGALGALICLAWFVPLAADTGGVAAYLEVLSRFGKRFQDSTSLLAGAGWTGLRRNVLKLGMYTLYGWSFALAPAGLGLADWLRRRERPARWETWIFLGLWVLPALGFYLLIHMGQQGLVFVFLPALLLGSAAGLSRLLAARPRAWAAVLALLMLLSAGVFLFAPEYPLGSGGQRLLTRETLAANDRYYRERIDLIRAKFAPDRTAILAVDWRHVEYYLPEYTVVHFDVGSKWEINQGQAVNAGGGQPIVIDPQAEGGWVVLFDPALAAFNHSPGEVVSIALSSGNLETLSLDGDRKLVVESDGFGLLVK